VANYTVALGQRINIPSWGSGLGKKKAVRKVSCGEKGCCGKVKLFKIPNVA